MDFEELNILTQMVNLTATIYSKLTMYFLCSSGLYKVLYCIPYAATVYILNSVFYNVVDF